MVPEAAAIVADLGRDLRRLAEDILDRLALEPAFGDARVEIAGIGRVMLVVMELHRLFVDGRLQRAVIIRQRRQFESHCFSPGYDRGRSEEHTSELQSLMRISYAVFCLKKKTYNKEQKNRQNYQNL